MAIELAIRKTAPKMSRKDAMQVIQGVCCTFLHKYIRARTIPQDPIVLFIMTNVAILHVEKNG